MIYCNQLHSMFTNFIILGGEVMTTDSKHKVKGPEIFLYAFGGIGGNIAFIFVVTYLMFFYNNIFGISAAAAGILLMVARLIDAFTDPIVGMLADRTKTKWGKFRPWIIFGAPLLGISVILLFSTPELGATTKLVYAYVIYISYSILSTVVNIPYHAITPVMTDDTNRRNVVVSAKQIGGFVGALIPAVLTIPLVKAFGGGAAAWQKTSVIMAVLMTITYLVCARGAKKRDTFERAQRFKKDHLKLKDQLKLIFKNKPLVMLMIAFGTDLVAFTSANAMSLYYWTFNVGDETRMPIVSLFGLLGAIPFVLLLPALAKRFGKRAILVSGSILTSLVLLAIFFVPYEYVGLLTLLFILSTIFALIPSTVGWSMLSDCVEYGEWKTGIRGEGTVSSSLTFINKFGMAIGALLAGIILSAIGFVANVNGVPQPQTEQTLRGILAVRTLFPIGGYICSIIAMKFYDLNSKKYNQILSDLEERRGE